MYPSSYRIRRELIDSGGIRGIPSESQWPPEESHGSGAKICNSFKSLALGQSSPLKIDTPVSTRVETGVSILSGLDCPRARDLKELQIFAPEPWDSSGGHWDSLGIPLMPPESMSSLRIR